MSAGLGLLIMQGCEDSKDTDLSGDLTNDFPSESRDSYDTEASEQSIKLTPNTINSTRIGEKITFTAQGGQTPYIWSVADSAAGTIAVQENTHYATYTVATVAENEIVVQDNKGVRASATINRSYSTLSISPSSPNVTIAAGSTYTFTASGGLAPYSWSSFSARGTITATGVNVTYTTVGATATTNTITLIDANGDKASTTVNHIL